MAFLENLTFTGSIGNMSAYRMRGIDKIVLRQKGGATKEQIKTSPRFALPRLYMSEFAGCSTMGKEVRRMLMPVRGLADYNISGPINKLIKVVQGQDRARALGKRSILLSKHPRVLEGFSLNKHNPFDAIIRNSLAFTIDAQTHAAQVDIPALIKEINFFPPNKLPLFSLTVGLGIVPDFTFNYDTQRYEPPAWYNSGFAAKEVSTPWYIAHEGSPATTLSIALDNIPGDASYSLMLSIGIRFGTLYGDGVIEQVKRTGAAKILALRGGNTQAVLLPQGDAEESMEDVAPAPLMDTKETSATPSTVILEYESQDTIHFDSLNMEATLGGQGLQHGENLIKQDDRGYHYTMVVKRQRSATVERNVLYSHGDSVMGWGGGRFSGFG